MPADSAIEVCHLSRTFRDGRRGKLVKANDDLSFTVPRGQVFGLLGPNGAGKTTLVSQLMGLTQPSSGTIRVEGIDVAADPSSVKAITGFLPQTGVAMRLIEVRRALHYTGRLRGQSEGDARAQTDEVIERLGLGAVANRYADRLSGGMMRLANFGMALMGRPKLLVLDEPTNELDPRNRRLVWDIVAELSVSHGRTVVLVTHNVLEAEQAVNRVAVMHHGRITALGSPGELKEQLGTRMRIEFSVKGGGGLTEQEFAAFGAVGDVVSRNRRGSYFIDADPDRLSSLVDAVTSGVGLARIDDFRLARPTLEDVYLGLDGAQAAQPNGSAEKAEKEGGPDETDVAQSLAAPAAPDVPASSSAPRMRGPSSATAFKYLWLEQMLEVRTTWTWSLVFGLLMPVAMVFGLTRIGVNHVDSSSVLYVVSGTAVFALTAEGVATLAQRVGAIRSQGMMVYYASLPITPAPFLAALVLSRLLLVLPGVFTPVIAARLMYGLSFPVSPALLLIVPLASLALSAFGLVVGMFVDSVELIVIITNLLLFVLLLAAPVLIPSLALPVPLRVAGYLLPPTYAADGFRHALNGQLGGTFIVDVLVLGVMAVCALYGAGRWTRWRTP
jgi:ABC-2 type transport system permease protein